jgi:Fur family ferric uptake transcriptional regulator
VTEPVDDLGVDAALDLVRSAGGRVTLAKRQVLAVLRANPTHLTAEAITSIVQEQAPEIAGSTVYRILEELERVGLVEHSHAGKSAATFHLRSAAHGHLVCQECGGMTEAAPALFDQLVASAADRYGFIVDPHHFAVLGVCARCAAP